LAGTYGLSPQSPVMTQAILIFITTFPYLAGTGGVEPLENGFGSHSPST